MQYMKNVITLWCGIFSHSILEIIFKVAELFLWKACDIEKMLYQKAINFDISHSY